MCIDDRWRCEANSVRPTQCPQEQAALASLTAARCFAKADKHPCHVADGLYIGEPWLRALCSLAAEASLAKKSSACSLFRLTTLARRLEQLVECPPAYLSDWFGSSGSIRAARNKHGLQKAGIKYVLNASPVVPCFHGSCFRYKTVAVYDDVDEDIAQHFPDTNSFIDQVQALP